MYVCWFQYLWACGSGVVRSPGVCFWFATLGSVLYCQVYCSLPSIPPRLYWLLQAPSGRAPWPGKLVLCRALFCLKAFAYLYYHASTIIAGALLTYCHWGMVFVFNAAVPLLGNGIYMCFPAAVQALGTLLLLCRRCTDVCLLCSWCSLVVVWWPPCKGAFNMLFNLTILICILCNSATGWK